MIDCHVAIDRKGKHPTIHQTAVATPAVLLGGPVSVICARLDHGADACICG